MKSTSDIMVKKSGTQWKQIESHVNRTQPYYSNKNIDIHRLGKNMDGYLLDYDKLMRKQFLPYLIAYNHKCVKQRKKSRMYGIPKKRSKGYRKYHDPVSDYLRHSRRRNERLVIFYLGNKNIRKRYYKVLRGKYGLTTEKIRDMENRSLVHTAYVWNTKNPYLKVTDFATNTDEKTAHIHTRMAITGLYGKPRDMAVKSEKNKGIHHYIRKPTMSFNKALVKTYPSAINSHGRVDSRRAMKAMRKKFDPVIINSFNRELAKNGINLSLELTRTGKVNHFTLKGYQAHKDMKRAESEAVSTEKSSASLSMATRASYSNLALSLHSALPNMTDHGKPAPDTDYLRLAKGQARVNLHGIGYVTGTSALSAANRRNMNHNKASIVSSYRATAENEAQPIMASYFHRATDSASSSASISASASASAELSSKITSLNTSFSVSNKAWQSRLMASLSISASDSAKSKTKALTSNSVAELASSASSVASVSKATSSAQSVYYDDVSNQLQSAVPSLTDNGSQLDSHEYWRIAKGYRKIGFNSNKTWLTGVSALSYANSSNSSNVASASDSVATASADVKFTMTSVAYLNTKMKPADKQAFLVTHSIYDSDKSIKTKFEDSIKHFVKEHKWANKIAQKLHKYTHHLKRLFHAFMPNNTDKQNQELATGSAGVNNRPERQEQILFSMEDDHALDLADKAREINSEYTSNVKSGSGSGTDPDLP